MRYLPSNVFRKNTTPCMGCILCLHSMNKILAFLFRIVSNIVLAWIAIHRVYIVSCSMVWQGSTVYRTFLQYLALEMVRNFHQSHQPYCITSSDQQEFIPNHWQMAKLQGNGIELYNVYWWPHSVSGVILLVYMQPQWWLSSDPMYIPR